MVPEIAAAVGFVSSLLRTRGCVSEQQLQIFSEALEEALTGERRRLLEVCTQGIFEGQVWGIKLNFSVPRKKWDIHWIVDFLFLLSFFPIFSLICEFPSTTQNTYFQYLHCVFFFKKSPIIL